MEVRARESGPQGKQYNLYFYGNNTSLVLKSSKLCHILVVYYFKISYKQKQ